MSKPAETKEWRVIDCPSCHKGFREHFEGFHECRECDGRGVLSVSPADRLALWPGGPFRGTWPGRYKQAVVG